MFVFDNYLNSIFINIVKSSFKLKNVLLYYEIFRKVIGQSNYFRLKNVEQFQS